jgi:hypothetical protein
MRAIISDVDTLRALKPLELAQYLRAKGWRQDGELGSKATLWVRSDVVDQGGGDEIILPRGRDFADFDLRMAEVLTTLARTEVRSELDVLRDVQTASADLVRLRAPARDAVDGSLAIESAVSFVEGARDLMLAAACAAIDKRSYFATRKAQQAMDYLQRVRMGQTERGSFVLTILSPVPPTLKSEQATLFPMEPPEPFERTVTRTLARSLKAVSAAAETAAAEGNMRPFIDAVQWGVSANLCDAIVRISHVSAGEGIDVAISWSPSRIEAADTPRRIRLQGDAIPLIEEAGRLFRETSPVDDFDLQGVVIGLHRPEGATIGRITVAGFVEGQARKVQIDLGESDYSNAIAAHDQQAIIECAGELVRQGRSYRLLHPRRFRLSGDEDRQ